MQVGMGEFVLWIETEAAEKRGLVCEVGPLKRALNPCAGEQERQPETRRICFFVLVRRMCVHKRT